MQDSDSMSLSSLGDTGVTAFALLPSVNMTAGGGALSSLKVGFSPQEQVPHHQEVGSNP